MTMSMSMGGDARLHALEQRPWAESPPNDWQLCLRTASALAGRLRGGSRRHCVHTVEANLHRSILGLEGLILLLQTLDLAVVLFEHLAILRDLSIMIRLDLSDRSVALR